MGGEKNVNTLCAANKVANAQVQRDNNNKRVQIPIQKDKKRKSQFYKKKSNNHSSMHIIGVAVISYVGMA